MTEVSFGEWLKRQRLGRGLTQKELARQIGCATITLRKIESEERHPSIEVVQQLIKILEIPQSEKDNFLKFTRGDWTKAPDEDSGEMPWRADRSTRTNLPASLTSFIGREKELNEVVDLLAQHRLVTLIGAGGMGKTRLSIEVARTLLSEFPDGVFFVAFAPLNDVTLIARTVLQAVGFVEDASRPVEQQLREGIGNKRMLLVLDNCEHLIEGIASLASDLLSNCPRIKIIVTSRESFRIPGEWIYTVPGFDIPADTSAIDETLPALMLFSERARAVQSDFILTKDNLQTVTSICAHLDGLPLAIELIAARMRLMPPQALLERLSGQFILNADGMRPSSERQKTLNHAIRWSYDLLTADEQKLLAYLSVFTSGFTLDAVEAMFSQTFTGQPISNLIASLLDKSLLQRALGYYARTDARYTMLVTIQEFARECLLEMGEEEEIRHRHLTYFCALAKQAEQQLRAAGQLVWWDRLDDELGNIRAALNWAQASGAFAAGLRLGTDLYWFWHHHAYHQEPILALENFLAQPMSADQIQVFARGHRTLGSLQFNLGNTKSGEAHLKESERLFMLLGTESKVDLSMARYELSWFKGWADADDPIRARRRDEDEALKVLREAGDQWSTALIYYHRGGDLVRRGDLEGARQALEQGLTLSRRIGDTIHVTSTNDILALIDLYQGNYAAARTKLETNLSFYRQARINFFIDGALWMLGVIAVRERDYARAKQWYTECLLFDLQVGFPVHKMQLAECLIGFAGIASAEERLERAVQLLVAAEVETETRGYSLENIDQTELERLTALLREELGEEKFEELASQGKAMTAEQAIAYALEETKD